MRRLDGDTLLSAGVGVKFYPKSWLSFSTFYPYRWSRWEDKASGKTLTAGGLSDPSLSVSFDLLELLNPSMIRTRCPETGGIILALKDDDSMFKSPHLNVVGGVSFPLGKHDVQLENRVVSALYQPGAGVWMYSAGVFYSQGIGRVTPSVGASWVLSGGMNSAGYDRPDSLVGSLSATWSAWPRRLGKLYAGLNLLVPMEAGRMRERKPGSILQEETETVVELAGSDKKMLLLDVRWSMWVASFWKRQKKIFSGLMVTAPLIEGESQTEPRNGWGVSLFAIVNF